MIHLHRPSMPRAIRGAAAMGASAIGTLALAVPASAHGPAPAEPPTVVSLLFGWTFPPLPTLAIIAALLWWRWAVGRVNAAHPANRVPRRRSVYFSLGMAALAFALLSGIERYDTALFSVHMVQHLLLTMVAPPLLALSAPITLLLRLSSADTRRRWILPVLHSRIVRVLAFPVVAWIIFAVVMWASHFTPLFDAALEDLSVHYVEHALYLAAGLLFWWPAVAVDPAPWRMTHPVRAMYVFLQMPQNTFLAVVLLGAGSVLYPHYETLERAWPPTALADQQAAAGIMWLVGDMIFLVAILAILWSWMGAERRDAPRQDRRAAAEMAAIRVRERALAERHAREADDAQSSAGASR
jgi:cytochrome c oxidase assembly factor CtaG